MSGLTGVVRRAWREFTALVLPTACAGCERPDIGLCADCLHALAAEPRRVDAEAPRAPSGLEVWAGPAFDGPVRDVLVGYKDRRRRDLTGTLGVVLAGVIDAAAPAGAQITLVPVPSNRAAVRRRGEDTLLTCARQACRSLAAAGTPARAVAALRATRRTSDQAGLAAPARAVNKQLSMAVRFGAHGGIRNGHRRGTGQAPCLAGGHVILIDDVVTTGATLAEAYRALTDAGVAVASAATIAATPHRSQPVDGTALRS